MVGSRNRYLALGLGGVALTTIILAQSFGFGTQGPAAKQPAKDSDVAFYEKEVLPILKKNCFECHGDEKSHGRMSLSTGEGVLARGSLQPIVSLKKPEESVLLKAINHQDDLEMPPDKKLPQKDIDILTRWVKAGIPGLHPKAVAFASKKDDGRSYWAYQPAHRPEVPQVRNKEWVRNPIDAFILSKVEAKGLTPAPPADRQSLVRRVYYDLIGLPPTPAEVDAFVNDKAPDAYERLIERLLASPHYGEKWARHWLDLVRYAETNGFEFDQNKPMVWRYRDYVIDAFNKDKPYDQFVREQLAGDMLPGANAETMIATGYYRLNQWDTGAADRQVMRYDALDNILSTTGQVFLGMSLGCARCHDHKADPILQKDYYQLLAFFHNLQDLGHSKTKRVMAPLEGKNQERLLKEKQEREIELGRKIYQLEQQFSVALANKQCIKVNDLPPSDMIELSYRFYRDTWEKLPDFDNLLAETEGPIAHNYFTLSPASRNDAIGLVFEAKLKVLEAGEYSFYLDSTEGARLIINGKTVLDRPNKGKQEASVTVKLEAGLLPVRFEYFNSYEKPRLNLEWSGPGVERRSLTEVPGKDMIDLGALIKEHGADAVGEKEVKIYTKLVDELKQSRNTPQSKVGIEISCVTESGNAPTYLLKHGNPKVKEARVDPSFPSVLIKKQTAVTGGRLALARWMTDPQTALPARVMANRLWQFHFGRGIVPSPNDFGKFGEQPTHPELLNWLASEFVAKGWKMKDMHRLIMTSNTYRMSSRGNEKALAVDPGNMLFWRFNMRRLTSDELRDSILAVSGKLNTKMGGPSVFPPIPKAVLAGQARPGQGWKTSSADEASRRSVYVFTKRSMLVPILAQFDMADTDQSCAVRFTTTVPTQALGLLNDQFSNDHAKLFVQRLKKEAPGGVEAQVTRAIRLTTGRIPSQEEIRKDVDFIRNLQKQSNLSEAEAMRFYCLMVLNTNEFIYLD